MDRKCTVRYVTGRHYNVLGTKQKNTRNTGGRERERVCDWSHFMRSLYTSDFVVFVFRAVHLESISNDLVRLGNWFVNKRSAAGQPVFFAIAFPYDSNTLRHSIHPDRIFVSEIVHIDIRLIKCTCRYDLEHHWSSRSSDATQT